MLTLIPIGHVRGGRETPDDDHWANVVSHIDLTSDFTPAALQGLTEFSHVEIIYHFHFAEAEKITRAARHPRGNPDWPLTGIFAQRAKDRPNHLGLSIAKLLDAQGTTVSLQGLDAIDGTPVLDIKPVLREFLPRGEIRQPAWCAKLMRNYW